MNQNTKEKLKALALFNLFAQPFAIFIGIMTKDYHYIALILCASAIIYFIWTLTDTNTKKVKA
jgi:hypothetical protein